MLGLEKWGPFGTCKEFHNGYLLKKIKSLKGKHSEDCKGSEYGDNGAEEEESLYYPFFNTVLPLSFQGRIHRSDSGLQLKRKENGVLQF
jgi:hypothetical protein